MASEFTFIVNKTCPICKNSTRVVKLKAKLPVVSVDEAVDVLPFTTTETV